jgi:hypothetical protein
MIRLDLIGPVNGDHEELEDRPSERYLVGMLAPSEHSTIEAVPDEELGVGDAGEDVEEGQPDAPAPAIEQLIPAALGMTFVLDAGCRRLSVAASWGSYSRGKSETLETPTGAPKSVWQRVPAGGRPIVVDVPDDGPLGPLVPDADHPEVVVRGRSRMFGERRIVTLFLVNGQDELERGGDAAWLFQAELLVRAPDGAPVFASRSLVTPSAIPDVDRMELASLNMLYRHECELAVGHGIATHATHPPGDHTRAVEIRTVAIPSADVPLTEAPTGEDFADQPAIAEPFSQVVTDMKTLGEASDAQLPQLLDPLVDAYEAWIDAEQLRAADPKSRLQGHAPAADANIEICRDTARRMRAGIAALIDPDVAEAFRFANLAMWRQRVHTVAGERRRGNEELSLAEAVAEADQPGNRSWRPFQLAFVLLNLPALADPCHSERHGEDGVVDLLFFPTGGGKTEAYLGLTAFTLAIRRLQGEVEARSGFDGVAVLMRYTLRLLTLQQFQRATALICACELLRRERRTAGEERWGATPFRIGLWVGRRSTPTTTEQADAWAKQAAKSPSGFGGGSGSPMQLARCPWCASELKPGRDLKVDLRRGRTLLFCSDLSGACPFTGRESPGEGLPVVVVDEELYRLLPSLVIATVDKFALMPWVGRTEALFGQVSRYCARHGYLTPDDHPESSHPKRGDLDGAKVEPCSPLRPPDLIIQDELHLISGPLGSLVGLYETAIDRLCTWQVQDRPAGPKIIASTATIRRAALQVDRLYARKLAVFPPPALDARDTFFSLQRDRESELEAKPGRRYLGICAPGRRFKSVLIRVYIAELGAAQALLERYPGEAADAYMTVVGYFNSLRELGGTRRLVEDDVQARVYGRQIESRGFKPRGRLEVEELTSRRSADEIPRVLDKLGVSHEYPRPSERKAFPVDVLLATNMISVGVDVPRLGTMIVAGQPKSTSEYIQATSRVGRRYPGLVLSVLNWARPRDISHYETFEHYHSTLYRQIEALSVTPFAPMALKRGLTGVLASMIRLSDSEWNANDGAASMVRNDPRVREIVETIAVRAAERAADQAVERLVRAELDHRLDQWQAEQDVPQRSLVYSKGLGAGAEFSLLKQPDVVSWSDWTVPMSMRDVEPPVSLVLRERGIVPVTDEWDMPAKHQEADDEPNGEENP